MLEISSIALAFISIILGIYAIVDSRRQNKQSKQNLEQIDSAITDLNSTSKKLEEDLEKKTDEILGELDEKIMEIIRRQFPSLEEKSKAEEQQMQNQIMSQVMGDLMQNDQMKNAITEMMLQGMKNQ